MEPLDQLITAVEGAARTDPPEPDAVAAALAVAAAAPAVLSVRHRRPSPYGYRSNLVHVAADGAFSIVAVVWLPGQATTAHAHHTWSVVVVCDGALAETTYQLDHDAPAGAVVARRVDRRLVGPGERIWTPASRVHTLANAGPRVAVSLHVHGPGHHERGAASLVSYESTD